MTAHARVRSPLKYGLMALAIATPGLAHGAGMELPENGAYVLARGGTAVSLTGTAYALQFNPAGLTGIENMDIRLDVRLVSHDVSFTRSARTDNVGSPLNFKPVTNEAGPFPGPGVMAAYRPRSAALRDFVFGFGVFGPPGVGTYKYADPRDAKYKDGGIETDEATGQRYSLISNSNSILIPTVSAAWSPIKELGIGMSVQAVRASISFSQSIAGKSVSGFESAATDGIAQLDMKSKLTPTFMFGAIFRPIRGLTIGASFKPPVKVKATGTFEITPPDGVELEQIGKDASLELTLAGQSRLGASYEWSRYSLSLEGVMQGWSDYRDLVIDASNVQTRIGDGPATSVGIKKLPKNWQDSYGARAGFSAWILQPEDGKVGVQGHLGALFETTAIPSTSQAVDTVNGNRFAGSLGVTARYGAFSATVAGMYYPQVTITSTDSEAKRSVASAEDPDVDPIYVGRGTYTSSAWIAAIGLAYTPGAVTK